MKKIFFLCAMVFALTITSRGQGDRRYRKFKGEFSMGYARFPGTAEIKNGMIITLEPKYLVLDQLALCARLEGVLLGKNFNIGDDEDFKVKAYQSALFAAEYYFTKDFKVRPFVGGGAGIYSVVSSGTDYYYEDDELFDDSRKVKFGGMVRAGVEIRNFRLGLEYNAIPNTKDMYYDDLGEVVTRTNKNTYFSIKLGYCFGGGLLNR